MLQVIKLDQKLLGLVLSGEKTRTVREGRRAFKRGDAVFEIWSSGRATGERVAIAVEDVTYKTFGTLTDQDAAYEGYADAGGLRQALLGYYPDLGESSEVTIVAFLLKAPGGDGDAD